VEYQNNHTKVAIGCKEEDHGLFHQTPSNHIKGQGCPKCLHRNETRVEIALNKLGIKHTKISIEANNRKYYPDFFLPDYNMYIEYQGLQHYEGRRFSSKITQVDADAELILQQKRDIEVRQYCKENGIGLLEIDGRKYQGKRIEKFLTEYFAGKLIK
jgi:hypothetical protein